MIYLIISVELEIAVACCHGNENNGLPPIVGSLYSGDLSTRFLSSDK